MNRPPCHSSRWSLRRTLLGIVLVLHVAWLTLGAVPVASAATHEMATATSGHAMQSMPCHDGMVGGMAMNGMSMDDHDMAGMTATPRPPKSAPAHLPCCSQNCSCASGLCAISALVQHGTLALVQYQQPLASFPMPVSRTPTPELRPPILH